MPKKFSIRKEIASPDHQLWLLRRRTWGTLEILSYSRSLCQRRQWHGHCFRNGRGCLQWSTLSSLPSREIWWYKYIYWLLFSLIVDAFSGEEIIGGLLGLWLNGSYVSGRDGIYSASQLLADAAASPQQIINLAEATAEQANSSLWKAHRIGRVTASNVFCIVHCRDVGA